MHGSFAQFTREVVLLDQYHDRSKHFIGVSQP